MPPQSIVLLITPKAIFDFANPDSSVGAILKNYESLLSRANETILIFAVGNSDHILMYRGRDFWNDNAEWARTTDLKPVSERVLNYYDIHRIIDTFRTNAASLGIKIKVYDHIDSGSEFTVNNTFKYSLHSECTANRWGMFDIRGELHSDASRYASEPSGIPEGQWCGAFLADQVAEYIADLGFDGIMYDNQLGTRGRWRPGDGPGYTQVEANAIDNFMRYSKTRFAGRELMWFDSYNSVPVEHDTFSFPTDGYQNFAYLIASGFCAVADSQYPANLKSKLAIVHRPRILATLDYVDPWYTYNSMTTYRTCSKQLEQTAIDRRREIDGLMFFANDETGNLIPVKIIESFASRFFAQ